MDSAVNGSIYDYDVSLSYPEYGGTTVTKVDACVNLREAIAKRTADQRVPELHNPWSCHLHDQIEVTPLLRVRGEFLPEGEVWESVMTAREMLLSLITDDSVRARRVVYYQYRQEIARMLADTGCMKLFTYNHADASALKFCYVDRRGPLVMHLPQVGMRPEVWASLIAHEAVHLVDRSREVRHWYDWFKPEDRAQLETAAYQVQSEVMDLMCDGIAHDVISVISEDVDTYEETLAYVLDPGMQVVMDQCEGLPTPISVDDYDAMRALRLYELNEEIISKNGEVCPDVAAYKAVKISLRHLS